MNDEHVRVTSVQQLLRRLHVSIVDVISDRWQRADQKECGEGFIVTPVAAAPRLLNATQEMKITLLVFEPKSPCLIRLMEGHDSHANTGSAPGA